MATRLSVSTFSPKLSHILRFGGCVPGAMSAKHRFRFYAVSQSRRAPPRGCFTSTSIGRLSAASCSGVTCLPSFTIHVFGISKLGWFELVAEIAVAGQN